MGGGHYVGNFLEFLISLVFGIYMLLVMLRFLFQLVRADFYNPLSQFVVRATSPVLRPMRRLIPGIGGIDVAALVLLLALQFAEVLLIGLLPGRSLPPGIGILALVVGLLIKAFIYLYFFSILIQVVLSWINPMAYHHPVGQLVVQLNEPLMRPIRRLLPPMGGLDLSPMVAIVILAAFLFLLANPLIDFATISRYR
jgi:YggT family protein